jgi:hypothetical protein
VTRREHLSLLLAAGLKGATPLQTSGPAFHYAAVFPADAQQWYSRFPILVAGGILDGTQSRVLKVNGTKLIAYLWTSAYYPGDASSAPLDWQARVAQQPAWLLNATPVGGGAAAPGKVANWYDFGNPDCVSARAADAAARLTQAGYDGYFFDTLGSEQLPASVLQEFQRRHPSLDYNVAQGGFIAALRSMLPGKLMFTNQGFRHAPAYLPYADLDLTESYFTAINGSGTLIRPWNDSGSPWTSVKVPMEQLVLPAARAYTNVRFVHLNYAAGSSSTVQRAVSYSYAGAKLFGHEAYLVDFDAWSAERDEVYFSQLGQPLTTGYQELTGGSVAWREYEKGVVAINSGTLPVTLPKWGFQLADPPRGYVFSK